MEAISHKLNPRTVDFVKSKTVKKMFIGGQFVEAVSNKTFPTYNPANNQILAYVAEGDKEDIDRAVACARDAFETGPWQRMLPAERARLIYTLADLIERDADVFAEIESLDNGKPISEAKGFDVPATVEHFRYYAGWATKITGDVLPVNVPNMHNYVRREPIGVVGQIIPWNFPLLMAAWKLGAALATGCTIVLKPAEQTPLSALYLGKLIQEAGFPAGVVNIVTGFGETAGNALVTHPDVDKIAFTGSTEVGKLIMSNAAVDLKRVSLELGGKSPNIIFPDADFSRAVQGSMQAIFFNQGQVCSAGSRLYIHKSQYDNVLSDMVTHASKVRQGFGIDPKTQMGPLVSEEQLTRVTSYINKGLEQGAKIAIGGERGDGDLARGYFVRPTVFYDVQDEMAIAQEEIFGPVVAAMPFDDIEDVIARANRSTYGLAAGVWTQNMNTAFTVANRLKAGSVWINCYNMFDAASPFGGYKHSGIGREMGEYALENYTQIKSVWVNYN
ncbi:aldehyde dehydrogenase family protein [Tumebacillus permanentifrigoris]|uniref:Aldehyde dehydrogenase (Acceptor) n=1 Tax=Tumebacillus permanentifrigoris TaxID=378543 RepID=A0A316DAG9_9BACL|nr:aldehyde dehydrogenase family protein [Tumebacillus permanentifrigoris]PWK13491.1 aldehyde dehydrogenase (acceptor) [Tumebacillus permanentifrigoris]